MKKPNMKKKSKNNIIHLITVNIMFMFVIVFAGFFVTQYAEDGNAPDSIVIVSNQFTGNGYYAFGNTISGKLNSLLRVWGGYILSGVGAATLTASIVKTCYLPI